MERCDGSWVAIGQLWAGFWWQTELHNIIWQFAISMVSIYITQLRGVEIYMLQVICLKHEYWMIIYIYSYSSKCFICKHLSLCHQWWWLINALVAFGICMENHKVCWWQKKKGDKEYDHSLELTGITQQADIININRTADGRWGGALTART